jgi:hypothetical protein
MKKGTDAKSERMGDATSHHSPIDKRSCFRLSGLSGCHTLFGLSINIRRVLQSILFHGWKLLRVLMAVEHKCLPGVSFGHPCADEGEIGGERVYCGRKRRGAPLPAAVQNTLARGLDGPDLRCDFGTGDWKVARTGRLENLPYITSRRRAFNLVHRLKS